MPGFLYFISALLLLLGAVAILPALSNVAAPGSLELVFGAWFAAALLAGIASIGNRVGAQTEAQENILRALDEILGAIRSQRPDAPESDAQAAGEEAEAEPPAKKPEEMTYPELVEHVKRNRGRTGG